MKALLNSNDQHIELINKYFLTLIAKDCRALFNEAWERMAQDIVKDRNSAGVYGLLICLSVAKSHKLIDTDRTIPLQNDL